MRHFKHYIALAATLTAASPAAAVTHYICWTGGAGYSMTGVMSYPDALANTPIITQDDVTEFKIVGYFEGRRVGSWSLDEITPETSWLLRYDTAGGYFPLTGFSGLYQMWNANGLVDDCGTPGFGFNAGNGGQDVCVDGTYIASSTINWDTPLTTQAVRPQPDCNGPALLGSLAISRG